MILGFYYHLPILSKNNKLVVPGYLGVFIDELAKHSEKLILFMHEAHDYEIYELDYDLQSTNVNWINIGKRTPAWHRSLFNKKILNAHAEELKKCNILLVRGPSPLAPYFKNFTSKEKIIFLLVGDYLEGAKQFTIKSFRDRLIVAYLKANDKKLREQIKQCVTVVNSESLYQNYHHLNKHHLYQIKTTTLSQSDFYFEKEKELKNPLNLIYTGRIDLAKGLRELVEATYLLNQDKTPTLLHIVGWELNGVKNIENTLKKLAKDFNIEDKVVFHGKKKVGKELNEMYRKADIYVIPSYHEGFPRTIWEAMANGLPVITTPVGGIPNILKHEESALFVNTRDAKSIFDAVKTLSKNASLVYKLRINGQKIAEENTLEHQTKQLFEIIKNAVHE
jgi:glycosyltransferase involved in cell wall biosynthesis